MKKIRKRSNIIALIITSVVILIGLFVLFILLTAADRQVLFSTPQSLTVDGTERTYRIHKPKQQTNTIVVGLHGFGGSSRKFSYYTALHNVSDDHTLVVYPDAVRPPSEDIKTGWNSDFCCGSGWVTKTDDSAFLVQLIEQLKQDYNGDAQVYVAGFSNGAFMAQKLAAEHPDLIDGIAVSSGSIGTTKQRLSPSNPVPILLMHGERDIRVGFAGGTNDADPDFNWLPFEETRNTWQNVNGGDALTRIITYPENGHQWDGWRLFNIWHKKPNASHEAIRFFEELQS